MKDVYENPLCSRYASEKMQHLFSPQWKFSTFRRLWLALAESDGTKNTTQITVTNAEGTELSVSDFAPICCGA